MMKGKGSRKKAKGFEDHGFTDEVLSWSLEHILDQNHFKDKVEKIPESFQSVEQYFGSFVFPLLEETRAQLCSGMETISRMPFAKVVAFEEFKPHGKRLYDVKVDYWRNSQKCGKEPYKILPQDIFVLTDAAKPETASDLQRVGRMWTLLSVTKISADENESGTTSTYFKVKSSKNIQLDDEKKKSLFVIFLTNITTNRRIWISLQMSRNSEIIKRVLCTDAVVDENCELCSQQSGGRWYEEHCPSLSSTLNNSQVEAVFSCLHRSNCNKATVELIWGPPGTGKTKTVSMLLFTLLRMRCRTLVCAPTNVAITEVASRVVKLVKESSRTDPPLGDILLFGNNERLKVGAEVEEIYLDYRIERLANCFGPLTGWRHCLPSMIEFLEDCVSQYDTFLQNELMERGNSNENVIKEKGGGNKTKGKKGECKSFLGFVRERFNDIATSLGNCISLFCTHIPKNYISEKKFQIMVNLITLLNSFKTLLFKDNLVSEELKELFSRSVIDDFPVSAVDIKSQLHNKRSECHCVLKNLWVSLNKLDLPKGVNGKKLKDFCFKKASLIFCTASSSFKLHSVAMEPLNFLVVDEAAQLKESESTIPLQLPSIKHAVLIGDEQQLPAMVGSNVSDEAGLGRSLFERLSSLGHSKHLLNIQYRMHPSIISFANSYFYQNKIENGPNVTRKSYRKQYLPGPVFGSYSFINIVGGREEFDDVGRSCRNLVEVSVLIKILQKLYKAWTGSRQKLSIGIVSPYNAQVIAIQEKLGYKYQNNDSFSVKVKSVDGFQGGEEDIIIISTVRSNSSGSIGFVSKPQRINVAVTRARHCLWILGNERTLMRSESVWETLVRDAKYRQCFFDADDDKDLAKAILEVKKESNELDQLLNIDSICFRSQRWKVIFSDELLTSFKKMKSDGAKKSVLNLLLKLASGWRPKKKNKDSICGSSMHMFKQFKVEGLCIVCTIEIVKELQYLQVLKVWDILPLEDVPKLVECLDNIFVNYTDDYVNHCKEKCLEGSLEVPKTWEASSDIVQFKDLNNSETESESVQCHVENSNASSSPLKMKFYTLSSGIVSHLLSDREGRELDLPFEGTDEQKEIILFSRSTFILGQSGTGKITVLTIKLFQKEKLHHMPIEESYGVENRAHVQISQESKVEEGVRENKRASLRQLFVTVSPKLCFAAREHISHLKSSAFGGKFPVESSFIDIDDIDDATEFKDIPNSFVDIPPKLYPLVITFRKFLMMLDGTLGNSYFERLHDASKHSNKNSQRSIALHTFIRTKEVNYERFSSLYWPHFNLLLTRKLDSTIVFAEIISHIKGSLQSMELGDGKLSREDYVQLSEGKISPLSRKNREIIYNIYQDYERMKVENGEFDLADLVIDLHHRLKTGHYKGDEMNFVYVDEVQDLTMSQIMLFKYVCKNVEEGFVFSGDTAQTIAKVNFRFLDIRSLFYKKFFLESSNDECDGRKEKGKLSDIFKLSQNFHTHESVLKLAQSIIDLFYRFFPQSIDVLTPETSIKCGKPPVFLESDDKDAIMLIFGNNETVGWNTDGFGAEQVILVRDDCARKEISRYVGKQAIVLTIAESKGLDFQDVLLYNFFSSSPLKSQWGVIYEYMKEQDLLDCNLQTTFPSFSEAKHNLLCVELKLLYLAITRARQRLWICEKIEELSKPMFDYWKKKFLVQVKQLDDSFARSMKVASSPEEWRSQGIKLFYERNYDMATLCFERAKDIYWERKSKATGLKAAADHMRSLKPEEANVILRESAELFEDIGNVDFAARCFSDLGEYERAAMIYLEKCGQSELPRAGECFLLAGRYDLAADVYARGNFFSECLTVCFKAKLFDIGVQYIHQWKQNANGDVGQSGEIKKIEQNFLESCALHYHELKDNKSMMKFVKAFQSSDLIDKFLRSLSCFDELLSLEEESGSFVDAANIAKLRGDILPVVDLLQKAGNFEEASTLILNCVLFNSLWSPGSKGWPLKKFKQKKELLQKAKSLAKIVSNHCYEFVCSEAEVLSNKQINLFMLNQHFNASKRHQSKRGEILSARKILDVHLHSKTSKYRWDDELVMDFRMYSEDTICENEVTLETLVYFWNYWKDAIANILEYLGCLETQDADDYRIYEDFCLSYLGVWKLSSNLEKNYVLLNSDADWVGELDTRYAQRSWNLVSIDACRFVSAARSYWSSELLSVSIKVLDTLEVLHKQSREKKLSAFCQIKSFTYICEVAKFLSGSKFLYHLHHDAVSLSKFEPPTELFFDSICPLDWRESLAENMISLRGTEVFRSTIKAFIFKYTSLENKLSYEQIGHVAVMILGSGKLNNDLHENVIKGFDGNTPWKEFVERLPRNMGSQCSVPDSNTSDVLDESLIQKFHGALVDTYEARWRKEHDYISPACFLYLLERLMILVSYFQGYILATKSSFIDWLIYQEGNSNLVTSNLAIDVRQSLGDVQKFVCHIVQHFLYNEKNMKRWVIKFHKNVKHYHSLAILRLVSIVCLFHLNFDKCANLLFDVLGRKYITDQLPQEFCEALLQGREHKILNVDVIAEAFKKIGNPLVIMSLGKNLKFLCQDAIFVDLRANKCKEDILRILFPKIEASQDHAQAAKLESTILHQDICILDSYDQGKSSNLLSSNSVSVPDQQLNAQNYGNGGNLVMIPEHFWKIFEALNNGEDQKSILLHAPTIKVEVEKTIQLLKAAMDGCSQSNSFDLEDKSRWVEAAKMLEELKQLSAAVDMSELNLKENISSIRKFCQRLQARRPTMEPFLNQLLLQQYRNLKGEELEPGIAPSRQCEATSTNSKTEVETSNNLDKMKALPATIAPETQGTCQETIEEETGKSRSGKQKWRIRVALDRQCDEKSTNSKTEVETSNSLNKMKALPATIAPETQGNSQETIEKETGKSRSGKQKWRKRVALEAGVALDRQCDEKSTNSKTEVETSNYLGKTKALPSTIAPETQDSSQQTIEKETGKSKPRKRTRRKTVGKNMQLNQDNVIDDTS